MITTEVENDIFNLLKTGAKIAYEKNLIGKSFLDDLKKSCQFNSIFK